jgi:hypothetical protein
MLGPAAFDARMRLWHWRGLGAWRRWTPTPPRGRVPEVGRGTALSLALDIRARPPEPA